jgi:polysaccharide biosynthesis protein PslG
MARIGAALILLALLPLACVAPRPAMQVPAVSAGKPVSFALLEDYDKGDDLAAIARDFALMQELEIDTLRCSFGWDDYEPEPGIYDFAWLQEFVALAEQYGIQLRPYIGYTPEWAGAEGEDDGIIWNNPPRDLEEWTDFVFALATALADAPNVLSYEIYNEENVDFWWDGSVEQYGETLSAAAQAIRRADPDAQVLLGGLVYPDDDWLRSLIEQGRAPDYDVTPFHAYVETWSDTSVEEYLDGAYKEYFVPINNTLGEGEPIWINEMGFATTPGRSEREQANWFARAAATFLADPHIEHLGFYELRDLPRTREALGEDANYYLGLLRTDGSKKLAFATVDLITDLLDVGTLTVADDEARVTVTNGAAGDLHRHLFVRPDGVQVLFVYDKRSSPTVAITLARTGQRAFAYDLDGTAAPFAGFDGATLSNVVLTPGEVAIFAVDP